MAYDFSTLDSADFEIFVRDLLNAKFKFDLQSFKAGKDKGIDLRQASPDDPNAVVVQGKHYLKSGFDLLFRDLENKELAKIGKLNPGRYMLVTSLALNPQEKDKLHVLLSPYLHSTNDIFGKEDLNKYLSELPDIETKWYKLWLTSIPVLTRILQNGTLGTNEFVTSKILRTTQLYVPCPSYDVAFEILKEHKYLLITGQPGVGKTTLAYYLTYNLLANGYQLLYVDTDIAQASGLFSSDPSVKQIVFFDDFLGETYLEINRPKTTESAFVLFLERIMASENKYLILTTRTTIYNNALDKYEKFERMKVSVARREIVLDQYSILDKARILFKHIYFADITPEFKEEIFSDRHYWEIIEHHNYNPRLIEFITSKKHVPADLPDGYLKFVLDNLNDPKEVWRHFYKDQLNTEERILLHVVFAQNYSARLADVKRMFLHTLRIEVERYNYQPSLNPFKNSLVRLLDGTLKNEHRSYDKLERISFINPSLTDFLKHYFIHNEEARHKLLECNSTIEQFEFYNQAFFILRIFSGNELKTEVSSFANQLMDRSGELETYTELKLEKNRDSYNKLRAAALLNGLFELDNQTSERITKFVFESVSNYPVENISAECRKYFCKTLDYCQTDSELYNYVKTNWQAIINELFHACDSEEDFENVKELFDVYDEEYAAYLDNGKNKELLKDCLRELADDRTNDIIRDERSGIFSEKEWLNLKDEIIERRKAIFGEYDLEDDDFDEELFLNAEDLEDLIEFNQARLDNKKENLTNTQKFTYTEDENLVREIEILFNGEVDVDFVEKKAKQIGLPF